VEDSSIVPDIKVVVWKFGGSDKNSFRLAGVCLNYAGYLEERSRAEGFRRGV
jgi:hypothetical protein